VALMQKIWFVRAGRDAVYVDDFLQHKIVAIGWSALGEISAKASKQDLLDLYQKAYADRSSAKAQTAASQIIRFIEEIKVGDTVMTFDREKRLYYLGQISSDYRWSTDRIPELPQIREVDWQAQVARSELSQAALNTLGAIQTLFLVKTAVAQELVDKKTAIGIHLDKSAKPSTKQASTSDVIAQEQEIIAQLIDRSEQSVEERLARLTWEEMQELVAGILRAMGYRTRVAAKGADRGVDIFASPDGLGLEEPRIFVEVKHRPNQTMSSQEIRAFLGGRSPGDKCLYVSTGGFTKDARYEADRSSIAITLLNLIDLRKLMIDYYEKIDEQIKSIIPLKRIYVSAEQDFNQA
jgi:restriction system protein